MQYTSKMGKEFLQKKHVIPNLVTRKWGMVLIRTHKLHWNTVWAPGRVNKEVGLVWLIWHSTPAVNEWRLWINKHLVTSCKVFVQGAHKFVLHKFGECQSTAWQWSTHILNLLVANDNSYSP